jgi:hypothetical protein
MNTKSRRRFLLIGTPLGDFLALAGAEHVVGAESSKETGEPHVPGKADPSDQRAFTFCFAMEHRQGERHIVEKPREYEFWRPLHSSKLAWPSPELDGGEAFYSRRLDPRRLFEPSDGW